MAKKNVYKGAHKMENLTPEQRRQMKIADKHSELYHKSILPLYILDMGVLIVASISAIGGEDAPHAPFPNEIRVFHEDMEGRSFGGIYLLAQPPKQLETELEPKTVIQLHDPNC